jgi:putative addiction module component (TIGR02574 family)
MAPAAADLLSNVLALPVRERAKVAHELLLSLDDGADDGANEAWGAELERRASEIRSGSAPTEDWDTVKARVAQRWRRPQDVRIRLHPGP